MIEDQALHFAHCKCLVLLGAPSDDPNVDRRVDMAFRKFLLRVDALRRQNFAAGAIADDQIVPF